MKRFLLFLWCLFNAHSAFALAPIPPLTSPVIDTTGTLSQEQINALTEHALALQHEKGSQLQTLIVPSTQPEDIAQYSQRVFDAWKLGREKVDDGVLFVVAKDDRRVRIHVGYGLEGILPDVTANRILNEFVIPEFKNENYAGGVISGASALKKIMEGEELPQLEKEEPVEKELLIIFGILVHLILIASVGIITVARNLIIKQNVATLTQSPSKRWSSLKFFFITFMAIYILLITLYISLCEVNLTTLMDLFGTIFTLGIFFILFGSIGLSVKYGNSSTSVSYSSSDSSEKYSRSSSSSSCSGDSSSSSWSGGGGSSGGGGASGSW